MTPRYLVDIGSDDLKKLTTDYLVVGAGAAGLMTALELAKDGEVTVLTKQSFSETNTKYAQGGIAAAWQEDDSARLHYQDTIEAGAGLCNPQAVQILVNEAKNKIEELIELGVEFDKEAGNLALTKEGGHSKARVLHAGGDATGKEINTTLAQQAQDSPKINRADNSFVLDLWTEDNICYGAYVYDSVKDEYIIYQARAVVLATGGSGELYSFTSNPKVATGDGIAVAYRAGAEVMDLEMMQFHPTVLNLKDVEPFLISEALRGEGAKLRRKNGERFMSEYHEQAELAPRDIVARAIKAELSKTKSDYLYLDITSLEADFIAERFPTIYKRCCQAGLDISQDYIPIRPAAHYFMGGVKTNTSGQTNLERLYACGEVSCVGAHGANRLASNSLLEALVYGSRAAEKIKRQNYRLNTQIKSERVKKSTNSKVKIRDLKVNLQNMMMNNVAIVREEKKLKATLHFLEQKLELLKIDYTRVEAWELQNLLTTAYLMTKFALKRKESRGAHYRKDYPKNRNKWRKHIVKQRNKEWRSEEVEFK